MTDDEKDKEAEAIIDKLKYTDKEKLEKFMKELENSVLTIINHELENNRASIEKTRDDLIKGYEKFKDSQK